MLNINPIVRQNAPIKQISPSFGKKEYTDKEKEAILNAGSPLSVAAVSFLFWGGVGFVSERLLGKLLKSQFPLKVSLLLNGGIGLVSAIFDGLRIRKLQKEFKEEKTQV